MRSRFSILGTVVTAALVLTTVAFWPSLALSAGTVTVSKSGNGKTIFITGDAEDNIIGISESGDDLEVLGDMTMVVGSPVSLIGVTKVIVKMKAGFDFVAVGDVDRSELDWLIKGEQDDDIIFLQNITALKVKADGGPGISAVVLNGITVTKKSQLNGGGGDEDALAVVNDSVSEGPIDVKGFERITALPAT